MTRSAGWLANAALLLFTLLLSLAAVEAGLRIMGTVPPSLYEADSTLVYRLVPGGHKTFVHAKVNGGHSIPVAINGEGYRGPLLRAPGSAKRIAVYGDSFVEGEYAVDSLTFPRMLERELAKRGPTEVINAGVVGWGPDQAYLRMRREQPALKPDVEVLAIFADNDMGDVVRNRLFLLGKDSALVENRVTLHPLLQETLSSQSHPTGWRRLHLVRWIDRKLHPFSGSLPATRSRAGEPKFSIPGYAEWAMFNAERQYEDLLAHPDTVLDLLGDSYDIDVSARPDSPSARYKVAMLDRLLDRVQADMASRGVPLVLLSIPSPIDACENYDLKVDPVKYPQYDRRRITRIVDSLATRHAIKHIDLWEPFRAKDACSLYYRGGDLHWKENGQAIAVQVMADSLAAWKLAK